MGKHSRRTRTYLGFSAAPQTRRISVWHPTIHKQYNAHWVWDARFFNSCNVKEGAWRKDWLRGREVLVGYIEQINTPCLSSHDLSHIKGNKTRLEVSMDTTCSLRALLRHVLSARHVLCQIWCPSCLHVLSVGGEKTCRKVHSQHNLSLHRQYYYSLAFLVLRMCVCVCVCVCVPMF